jgi:superfamily II DNA/RNA helicase
VAAGYETPTEIQARMLPLALEGRDVVARSRTGTGKTCAFLVPALASLDEVQISRPENEHPRGPVRVLVVTPTRELAMQVAKEGEKLARYVPARTLAVYGGTQIKRQVQQIPTSAIVVGTPGRLLDHVGRRTLDLAGIEILVLDEVDRMYDLGFRDDVDRILRACGNRRQTILVSATLNEDVEMLVDRHMGRHDRIEIESATLTVDEVEQTFYVVEPNRKREMLAALIRERRPERTIVFTRTRFTADRVAYVLQQEGFDAQEIHSGLPQRRREGILGDFRKGKLALLVATDVAARGLDIEGVDHVINFDIPQAAEDYVHRVGRTARMGKEGWAVTFVTPDDGPYLTSIEKLINKEIRQERFPGFGPPPPVEAKADEDGATEAPAKPKSRGIPNWSRPARKRR